MMRLEEIRKFVKMTESLSDDTTLFWNFCGYTSDDEWLHGFTYGTDGESEWVTVDIKGKAYSTDDGK